MISRIYIVFLLLLVFLELRAQFFKPINTSIIPTYSEINKNGDIVIAQATSFDSVEILNTVLKPFSTQKPIFGRSKEIYITRIDTNQRILDNLQFYRKEGRNIIGSYLFENDYYFVLTNYDTIFYKDTFFTNTLNYTNPTYLFCKFK